MKQITKLIFGIVLGTVCSVQADLYTAENVVMSGEGNNPVVAKNNAITTGELRAFDQVILGLIGAENEAFIERPSDEEILSFVRDISIVDEKKTATTYWGKMNVRFKEKPLQDLIKKNKLSYLQKATPVYWLIPIWRQGADRWTMEDENPFYQMLKTRSPVADSFQMILPVGDVRELVAVERALEAEDFDGMSDLARANRAERLLVIDVQSDLDGHWKMRPLSYRGTENIFDGVSVEGNSQDSLSEGWDRLNLKMATRWQEKYRLVENASQTYYARFHLSRLTEWEKVKRELEKLHFLKDLTLQGAMSGQLLISFTYAEGLEELSYQLDKAGFIWLSDGQTLGTLARKDIDENTL